MSILSLEQQSDLLDVADKRVTEAEIALLSEIRRRERLKSEHSDAVPYCKLRALAKSDIARFSDLGASALKWVEAGEDLAKVYRKTMTEYENIISGR